MSFADVLEKAGWKKCSPIEYRKQNWTVYFDTGRWMEVGTTSKPRVFDVPVPEAGLESWTINLIHHLCAIDDELQILKANTAHNCEPGA